jgi:CrcB protein
MTRLVYIALFGLAGVFARYYCGLFVGKLFPGPFPLGTFLINIVGAFIIGGVYVLGVERGVLTEDLRIGVMVGFLGGFTTFSSYCLEITRLIEEAEFMYAAIYFFLSSALGILGSAGGMLVARKLGNIG